MPARARGESLQIVGLMRSGFGYPLGWGLFGQFASPYTKEAEVPLAVWNIANAKTMTPGPRGFVFTGQSHFVAICIKVQLSTRLGLLSFPGLYGTVISAKCQHAQNGAPISPTVELRRVRRSLPLKIYRTDLLLWYPNDGLRTRQPAQGTKELQRPGILSSS